MRALPKGFKEACALVESVMRRVGPNCEAITLDRGGVQVACLRWGGCVVEKTLYVALKTALEESDER
jgi:hypothetical protein